MKRIALLAIVCCSLVLTSCFRPQQKYVAAITEWHIANHDNEMSVKAVLSTIHSFWEGEYAYKGMTPEISDIKALVRYAESDAALLLNDSKFTPYLQSGDYFIYSLTRTTDGEVLLKQMKYYVDEEGDFRTENIYDLGDVQEK